MKAAPLILKKTFISGDMDCNILRMKNKLHFFNFIETHCLAPVRKKCLKKYQPPNIKKSVPYLLLVRAPFPL